MDELEGHVILLVGYGIKTNDGIQTNYWIYCHSWGENWGNGEYGRICRLSSYLVDNNI